MLKTSLAIVAFLFGTSGASANPKCEAVFDNWKFLKGPEAFQILETTEEVHPSHAGVSIKLFQFAFRKYPALLDQTSLLLLKKDTAVLENLDEAATEKLARELIRKAHRADFPDVRALSALHKKMKSALDAAETFLVSTRRLRDQVLAEAQGISFEQAGAELSDHQERPSTDEERGRRLIRRLALSTVSHRHQLGISQGEAFVLALRNLRRTFNILREGADERLVSTYFIKAALAGFDPHSKYLTVNERSRDQAFMSAQMRGIGIVTRETVAGVLVHALRDGGPAARAGLREGDVIRKVNGVSVAGASARQLSELIASAEDAVTLTIWRGKVEVTVSVKPEEMIAAPKRIQSKTVSVKEGEIAYIQLAEFAEDVAARFGSELDSLMQSVPSQRLKGIVLDLRGNGGGLLREATKIASMFLPEGPVVAKVDVEGSQVERIIADHLRWKGPMVILVDEDSASASELLAGSFQDYGRAIIVGSPQTHGKGSYQAPLMGERGDVARLTLGLFHTVSGRSPQLSGVTPDIVVLKPDHTPPTDLERDLPNAIHPQVIDPLIDTAYPLMPDHDRIVSKLKERSEARKARPADQVLSPDPQLNEALQVVRDLAKINRMPE